MRVPLAFALFLVFPVAFYFSLDLAVAVPVFLFVLTAAIFALAMPTFVFIRVGKRH